MTEANKISIQEFSEIMRADLDACSEAYQILSEYNRLKRQRWILIGLTLSLAFLIGSLTFAVVRSQLINWVGFGLALLIFLTGALLILRMNLRLERSVTRTRSRWEQAGLEACPIPIMQLATNLAQKVIDYNLLADRLAELQTGNYWREFRQLSSSELAYIESTFNKVRSELIAGLQICRRLIDDPNAQVSDLLTKQVVSRDQVLVEQFTAKTITSNHYLNLAKSLTDMEGDIQVQLRPWAGRSGTA